MSIYVLLDYVEVCKGKNIKPTWKDLKKHKDKYWREV